MADKGDKKGGDNKKSGRKDGGKRQPTTRKEFADKGAAEQPKNGPNVKAIGKKCLTCIRYNGNCPGAEILGGKCESCRGLGVGNDPVTGKRRKRQVRNCFWLEPSKKMFTYEVAQNYYKSLRLPDNTTEKINIRKGNIATPNSDTTENKDDKEEEEEEEGEEEDPDAGESIWDLLSDTNAMRLVGPMVADAFDNGRVTDDSENNIAVLMDITHREYDIAQDAPNLATPELRQRIRDLLNTIYHILDAMRARADDLNRVDLINFLPDNHPTKHRRT